MRLDMTDDVADLIKEKYGDSILLVFYKYSIRFYKILFYKILFYKYSNGIRTFSLDFPPDE